MVLLYCCVVIDFDLMSRLLVLICVLKKCGIISLVTFEDDGVLFPIN